MHVRFSMCRGLPVRVEETGLVAGALDEPLIHPDTGRIEGFFVRTSSFPTSQYVFLAAVDILRFGTYVWIDDEHVLGELEERIRLHQMFEEGRSVLGQPIHTQSGEVLGTCKDVQFDTRMMRLEWIFPKKWFRYGDGIPASSIVEVRTDAVVVRDPQLPVKVEEDDTALPTLEPLTPRAS